jgi:response regulator RpfG family c-di-GMP phosphodiesterase
MHHESYTIEESAPNQTTQNTREQYARTILCESDFKQASTRLAEEGLLVEQVARTQEKFKHELEDATFLNERDWELLSMITIYSEDLATHSVETYQLVRSKIEHILIGSETIAQTIIAENVSLGEFFRACLLHDIGKTAIPSSVLNYALAPGDWQALANAIFKDPPDAKVLERLGLQSDVPLNKEQAMTLLMDSAVNPITTLSVHELLTPVEIIALEKKGFSSDQTLREILEFHEQSSQKILENEGLYTEAFIASQHHNYRREKYRYPISSQTIGLSADLTDLLRLADEEQALRSERPYKQAFSQITAFDILVKDAEKGAINKEMTALWIQNDLEKGFLVPESEEDADALKRITAFVLENCPKTQPENPQQ